MGEGQGTKAGGGNTMSKVPEYGEKRVSDFFDVELDKASRGRDIKWPGEESGANVTVSISINGKVATEGATEPEKKEEVERDERTGLPIAPIRYGMTAGMPDEAGADL